VDRTYRVMRVASDFDLSTDKITEHFSGTIDFPENWKIGVIVGKSGTGKTSIAKQLFPEYISNGKYTFTHKSVIDDMPESVSMEDITKMFYAVGFGSVPSWLKPYYVLSNGEKMRVELARALLEPENKIILFDEFTSVVDRDVAYSLCVALKKAMEHSSKQFIAVSCHYDILEWLQPDWVFNTDGMTENFRSARVPQGTSTSGNAGVRNGANLSVITI